MPLSSDTQTPAADAFNYIRSTAIGAKQQTSQVIATLQGGNIDPNYAFRVIDQFHAFISNMQTWQTVSGLDAYANSQGYTGSLNTDVGTCVTAAQACITWIVNNFPTSAGGWLQAQSINADGSRTLRQFTPAQTAGWVTALNSFIATIN